MVANEAILLSERLRTGLPTIMDTRHFMMIVAVSLNGGIGYQGRLPWDIPQDRNLFKKITTKVNDAGKVNVLIMGRITYSSLPEKFKPLPNRFNIVISNTRSEQQVLGLTLDMLKTPIFMPSLEEALTLAWNSSDVVENIFVIGGKRLFCEALQNSKLTKIFMTRVVGEPLQCDVFVQELLELNEFNPVTLSETYSCQSWAFDFVEYKRKNLTIPKGTGGSCNESPVPCDTSLAHFLKDSTVHQVRIPACAPTVKLRNHGEFQYLDLLYDVLNNGQFQNDRVGTLYRFGALMRFNLQQSFPLLTTKSVFFRGVVEELLWFIRGDTNANHLSEKGIRIWDANGSREFLDLQGLVHREVGDLGPIYGFQWRHFGAPYTTMNDDYTGKGVDQLTECINMLKNSPMSRRIIMSSWNPSCLRDMALPPCHILSQFSVSPDNRLSCILYQRSADLGLGVPFNIASYSLLTCLLAQVCGLERGEFIHVLGNAHIYTNHVEPIQELLKRFPRPFPLLFINPSLKCIDEIESHHITLVGYNPHPRLPMKMAV